jgi:hypothetical protein
MEVIFMKKAIKIKDEDFIETVGTLRKMTGQSQEVVVSNILNAGLLKLMNGALRSERKRKVQETSPEPELLGSKPDEKF